MNTTRRFVASGTVAAILAVVFMMSAPSVEADNAQTLAGTWVGWATVGPGVRVPALQTYQTDGTVIAADTFMFGGLPGVPIRSTPAHGVWTRTGAHTFAISGMFLIYDATSSVLIGFARTRATVELVPPEAVEFSGTAALEFLPCPSPFSCPDPQAPDAAWVPFPGFPGNTQVTAKRLRLVE